MLMLGTTAAPVSADEQSGARAAIELLQAAKKSNNPAPVLHDARKHLKNAGDIKGSDRLEAQGLIKEAITGAETGDKKTMEAKVNAAIAKIHKGMGNAR